jgi:PAS domain-containing protein
MSVHPEDRQRVLAEWHAAAQSNAPLRTEFRLQRGDGTIVWTRVNSAPVRDGMESHRPCADGKGHYCAQNNDTHGQKIEASRHDRSRP